MRWQVLFIGKPKLAYAKAGVEEYRSRLRRFLKVDLEGLKEGTAGEESGRLLKRSEGSFRLALDPRGKELGTQAWLEEINAWEMRSVSTVSVLIGGADGHHDLLRRGSDAVWSLSRLTLQHELALVVFLEQLYRVYSLKRGEPYHRE